MLGYACEYLIGQFAAGAGKKAGEPERSGDSQPQAARRVNEVRQFDAPQQISSVLYAIATLDSKEPKTGTKKRLESVMDMACGSGSLILNVRHRIKDAGGTIGKILGRRRTSPPTTSRA